MLECMRKLPLMSQGGQTRVYTHTDFLDKAFIWHTPSLTIHLDFRHENNSTAVVAIRAVAVPTHVVVPAVHT